VITRKGYSIAFLIVVFALCVAGFDEAWRVQAKADCFERTERAKEAARLVPYQRVTLCAGFARRFRCGPRLSGSQRNYRAGSNAWNRSIGRPS
jgi:hypothetical protein